MASDRTTQRIVLNVNGGQHAIEVEPRRTLVDALRQDLVLTGTKKPCGMGNCGGCTVLVDGEAVYSCLVLAIDCTARAITTIEGLAASGELDTIQQAFIEADAFQCGYCTPGQIMSVAALLRHTPAPSDAEIAHGMAGNLCRCGAYRNILRAVRLAADKP